MSVIQTISSPIVDEEERQRCPNPNCGAQIVAGQRVCRECQEAVQCCWHCRAKGRLLARFCRLCRAPLVSAGEDIGWAGPEPTCDQLNLSGINLTAEQRLNLTVEPQLGPTLSRKGQIAEQIVVTSEELVGPTFRSKTAAASWASQHSESQDFTQCFSLALSWELKLDQLVAAVPLVQRGIIILITVKGQILLLEAATGRVRAELFAGGTVTVTPVIIENWLIVAGGTQIIAFDLLRVIYGQRAGQVTWVWRQDLPPEAQVAQPLIATPTTVWVITRLDNQLLILALARETGILQTSWVIDATQRRFTAPWLLPLIVANELIVENKAIESQITDTRHNLQPPNIFDQVVTPQTCRAAGIGLVTSDGVVIVISGPQVRTYQLPFAVDTDVKPVVGGDQLLVVDVNRQVNIVAGRDLARASGVATGTAVDSVVNARVAEAVWAAQSGLTDSVEVKMDFVEANRPGDGEHLNAACPLVPVSRSITLHCAVVSALSISEHTLAVTHSGGVSVYDCQGQQYWASELDGYAVQTPAVILTNGVIVADNNGTLFGGGQHKGGLYWRQRIGVLGRIFPLMLTPVGLIVATNKGHVKSYHLGC